MSAFSHLNQPIVFSTSSYQYLSNEIIQKTGFDQGDCEVSFFPDGERYIRFKTGVADSDVILLGGTITDADTMELYDMACTIVRNGARSLILCIPYYGYSTMERAIRSGEAITAKTRARLISSIPPAAVSNRVLLLDLHADGIPNYFEGPVIPVHLYGKPVVIKAARDIGGDDFVLCATDSGRAKWVESLAKDLGVESAFVFKRRLDASSTEITAMAAQVEGKKVIIYDDMIRSGSTIIKAAECYHQAGATEISCITTHGIFPGNSLEKLLSTGLFKKIVSTNSHPRVNALQHEQFEVRSVAEIYAHFLTTGKGPDHFTKLANH